MPNQQQTQQGAAPVVVPAGVVAVGALVDQQASAHSVLSQRVQALLGQLFAGFDGWYDQTKVTALTSSAAQIIRVGQQQSAQQTAAYLHLSSQVLQPRAIQPAPVRLPDDLRMGVTVEQEMERAVKQFRYLRSTGADEMSARADAEARAQLIADTDLMLAMRVTSRDQMQSMGATEYRRVIRPELSRTGVCGLCIAAADRVYKTKDLLPIHDRCKCLTLPIFGEFDPGDYLNGEDLKGLYSDAGAAAGKLGSSTNARDLKKVRYQINHHGELGPVLGVKGQAFRGPRDLPSA